MTKDDVLGLIADAIHVARLTYGPSAETTRALEKVEKLAEIEANDLDEEEAGNKLSDTEEYRAAHARQQGRDARAMRMYG